MEIVKRWVAVSSFSLYKYSRLSLPYRHIQSIPDVGGHKAMFLKHGNVDTVTI